MPLIHAGYTLHRKATGRGCVGLRLSRFMGRHPLAVLRRRGYTPGMKPPPPKKKQALPTVYEPGVHPLPPLPTMQERVLAPPPEPVEGLHAKYTAEMQERGQVMVASLTGQRAKEGDWIVFRPSDGWSITVNNVLCRMIDDINIKARVDHHDRVW